MGSRGQTGAVWLGAALLMLLLVTAAGVTLSLMLTATAEQLLWRQQAGRLEAELESDINRALALLYLAENWPDDIPASISESVTASAELSADGAVIHRAHLSFSKADSLFSVTREFDIVRYPLLMSLPPAPLLLTATLDASAGFLLFLPSSVKHPLHQLSVWSAVTVDMTSNRFSCTVESADTNACKAAPLSYESQKNSDIHDGDPTLALPLPDYLFATSVDGSELSDYQQLAGYQGSDCTTLPAEVTFMWITGNCIVPANQHLGTSEKPVLIIIDNGHLELSGDTVITGLVVSLTHDSGFSRKLRMNGNARVTGGVIANHAATPDSFIVVQYHYPVLRKLQNALHLQQLAIVPGSLQ